MELNPIIETRAERRTTTVAGEQISESAQYRLLVFSYSTISHHSAPSAEPPSPGPLNTPTPFAFILFDFSLIICFVGSRRSFLRL